MKNVKDSAISRRNAENNVNGRKFEDLVEEVLSRKYRNVQFPYIVEVAGVEKKFDGAYEKGFPSKLYIVECKGKKPRENGGMQKVGDGDIAKFRGDLGDAKIDPMYGHVITNAYDERTKTGFSRPALFLAEHHHMTLWDGKKFQEEYLKILGPKDWLQQKIKSLAGINSEILPPFEVEEDKEDAALTHEIDRMIAEANKEDPATLVVYEPVAPQTADGENPSGCGVKVINLGTPAIEPLMRVPLASVGPKPGLNGDGMTQYEEIRIMDEEFDSYLGAIRKDPFRLQAVMKFGKEFSAKELAAYLRTLLGPMLYFDSLLSVTQQYGLADVDILAEGSGRRFGGTGFSLAFFGDSGTGKTFAIDEMIRGNAERSIPAHGLPGRNRFCGGMTAIEFIKKGQYFEGRKFNFIVPEFDRWFEEKGMINELKKAMEHGEIKYETTREKIGPYRNTSEFTVNYNIKVQNNGSNGNFDPHRRAIDDRMLCMSHYLTPERFREIESSDERLTFDAVDLKKADQIRDHLTLVNAIETGHPLAKGFPYKPILLAREDFRKMQAASDVILKYSPQHVEFSPRLKRRALKLAAAMSLLDYFKADKFIPINQEALNTTIKIYVEEAAVRSQGIFKPDEVLKELETAGVYRF